MTGLIDIANRIWKQVEDTETHVKHLHLRMQRVRRDIGGNRKVDENISLFTP